MSAGRAIWMVEVTKGGKEASKEVLMRAIQDLKSPSVPVAVSLKLVYVMTELDGPLDNGVSDEETFRREAAREMSKRAAESLLRSFLSVAQQKSVPVSACVERCADREHGLCTATRRFQAQRLYVAARKKLFSKSAPQWLLDIQSGVPPSCLVVAVQGEKKLHELLGTGAEEPSPVGQQVVPGPGQPMAAGGGLTAAQLQQHQFLHPQQQQILLQQQLLAQQQLFAGQQLLPVQQQQLLHQQMLQQQQQLLQQQHMFQLQQQQQQLLQQQQQHQPFAAAAAHEGRMSHSEFGVSSSEESLAHQLGTSLQVTEPSTLSRLMAGSGAESGSEAEADTSAAGRFPSTGIAGGGATGHPSMGGTQQQQHLGNGSTTSLDSTPTSSQRGSAQSPSLLAMGVHTPSTSTSTQNSLAASALLMEQQISVLSSAAVNSGQSPELQQQIQQLMALQQHIQLQLQLQQQQQQWQARPAGGDSGAVGTVAAPGVPGLGQSWSPQPGSLSGHSHSGSLAAEALSKAAQGMASLGPGHGGEVKVVRSDKERSGFSGGAKKGLMGELMALEEEDEVSARRHQKNQNKQQQQQQGAPKSSLADELAALEDGEDDGIFSKDSLSRANKWAAGVLSMNMGKSVSSNRFPEQLSGTLPGSGAENKSGAHAVSTETGNSRYSMQGRNNASAMSNAVSAAGVPSVLGVRHSQGTVQGQSQGGGNNSPRAPLAAEFFECRKFTPQQLQKATQNYSPKALLGKGSFGAVFRGELLGCQVAVKKLEGSGWQGPEEFHMEVEVLSKMRHPNIVLLMGCCTEEMALIYEFLPGGTLHNKLGPPKGPEAAPLAWSDRIRICSEISSALLYLHQNDPPIVHRDLKPDNILLDGHLLSKIGDVGLARLLVDEDNMTMKVRGTAGYIDPEEVETCEISVASDLYAFGLIMLQLITGQRHVKNVHRLLSEAWKDGVTNPTVAAGTVLKYLDNSGGEWPQQLAREVAELALGAAQRRREHRPPLADVIHPGLMSAAKRAEEEVRRRKKEADSQFICPLSKEIMRDPVVAADGFTYEREHIARWMAGCGLSPSTGEPFAHTALTPNNVLRNLILSHKAS